MSNDNLPPLPRPHRAAVYANSQNTHAVAEGYEMGGYEKEPPYYTEAQMKAYALAAIDSHLSEQAKVRVSDEDAEHLIAAVYGNDYCDYTRTSEVKAELEDFAARLSQGAQGEAVTTPCDGRGWGWACTLNKGHEGPCTTIPPTICAERAAVPDGLPEDTLDRLLVGKATEGDQLLAHNALVFLINNKDAQSSLVRAALHASGKIHQWRTQGTAPTYREWMDIEERLDTAIAMLTAAPQPPEGARVVDDVSERIRNKLPIIRARTGNMLFDAGVNDACDKIEAMLAAPTLAGEEGK